MHDIAFVWFFCVACVGHARRLQTSVESPHKEGNSGYGALSALEALRAVLTFNQSAAFNLPHAGVRAFDGTSTLPRLLPETAVGKNRFGHHLPVPRPAMSETMSTPQFDLILCSNALDTDLFWKVMPQRDSIKLVYIPTGLMYLDPDTSSSKSPAKRRRRKRDNVKKQMKGVVESINSSASFEVDIMAEFLDLSDDSITGPDDVRPVLAGADVVFVEAGNTWFLTHHIRRTGFETALKELPHLIYIGVSAGAIVAGKSVSMALWKNWDAHVDEVDTTDPEQLYGMGLAGDRSFFPHYLPKWDSVVAENGPQLGHEYVLLAETGAEDDVPEGTPESWVMRASGEVETS